MSDKCRSVFLPCHQIICLKVTSQHSQSVVYSFCVSMVDRNMVWQFIYLWFISFRCVSSSQLWGRKRTDCVKSCFWFQCDTRHQSQLVLRRISGCAWHGTGRRLVQVTLTLFCSSTICSVIFFRSRLGERESMERLLCLIDCKWPGMSVTSLNRDW